MSSTKRRGFSFDDLSSQMEGSAKRRKATQDALVAATGADLVTQIAALVKHRMPRDSVTGESLELELRVGRVDGVAFRPGLQHAQFDACLRRLRELAQHHVFVAEQSNTADYIFNPPPVPTDEYGMQDPAAVAAAAGALPTRWTVDARSGRVLEVLQKRQYHVEQVPTGMVFDLRMTLAGELVQQPPASGTVPKGHSLRRNKERWTFRRPPAAAHQSSSTAEAQSAWQLDLTKVSTTSASSASGSDAAAAALAGSAPILGIGANGSAVASSAAVSIGNASDASESVVTYELELEFSPWALAGPADRLPSAMGEALQFLEQLSLLIQDPSNMTPAAQGAQAERLQNEAKQAAQTGDPARAAAARAAAQAARAVAEAAALAGVNGQQVSLSSDFFKRVGNQDELAALRQTCVDWIPGWQSNESFPGPLPVAFSRRHFSLVQGSEYMVSEKSDGLRFFLHVQHDGAYLVDRSFDFFFVEGSDPLADVLAGDDVTVVDGELVRHEPTGRLQFMVFDVIVVNGESYAEKSLPGRLQAIGEHIVGPWRRLETDQPERAQMVPFELIGKRFFKKRDLAELFRRHIVCVGGDDAPASANPSMVRVFKDARRHHKTDGIIFTPTLAPYYQPPLAAENAPAPLPLLKWKYPPLITADFRMSYNAQALKWVFRCGTDSGEAECFDVDLEPADLDQLQRDMAMIADPNQRRAPVVELSYDIWHGVWRYKGLRLDKHVPNYIRTVFDTMAVIAENISQFELIYRVSLPEHRDRWRQEMTNALKKITASAQLQSSSSGSVNKK